MEVMLQTVKNVTVFILLFSIISNLFSKSQYGKYFEFIQGLIIIVLIMAPLLSWLSDGGALDRRLEENMNAAEEESFREELKMIGAQRDQMLNGTGEEGGGEADE